MSSEAAGNRTPPRRRRSLRPPAGTTLGVTLISVAVTAAVVAVVIVALSHHTAGPGRRPAEPASSTPRQAPPLPSRPTRRLLLREDRREHFHAPKRLLSAFAVFRHYPHAVTRHGVTLSRPPLAALPKQILELASPRRDNHVDIAQIREVRLSSTLRVWAMPGAHSLCTATSLPMPGERRVLEWVTGCEPIAAALDQGMGNDAGFGHGRALHSGMEPFGASRTFLVGHHAVATTFGVYGFVTSGRRHGDR